MPIGYTLYKNIILYNNSFFNNILNYFVIIYPS